ncbi:protein pxr1, partial [Reticulomyxa filosa]
MSSARLCIIISPATPNGVETYFDPQSRQKSNKMTNHKEEGSTNSKSYKKGECKRSKKTGSKSDSKKKSKKKSKKGKTATTITKIKKDNKQTLDQQIRANTYDK